MNRPKIIEAYQVPGGNVSPEIFKLPCVSSAMKLTSGNTIYRCSAGHIEGALLAGKGNYICKLDSGKWDVFTSGQYHEYLSDDKKHQSPGNMSKNAPGLKAQCSPAKWEAAKAKMSVTKKEI